MQNLYSQITDHVALVVGYKECDCIEVVITITHMQRVRHFLKHLRYNYCIQIYVEKTFLYMCYNPFKEVFRGLPPHSYLSMINTLQSVMMIHFYK